VLLYRYRSEGNLLHREDLNQPRTCNLELPSVIAYAKIAMEHVTIGESSTVRFLSYAKRLHLVGFLFLVSSAKVIAVVDFITSIPILGSSSGYFYPLTKRQELILVHIGKPQALGSN